MTTSPATLTRNARRALLDSFAADGWERQAFSLRKQIGGKLTHIFLFENGEVYGERFLTRRHGLGVDGIKAALDYFDKVEHHREESAIGEIAVRTARVADSAENFFNLYGDEIALFLKDSENDEAFAAWDSMLKLILARRDFLAK